MEEIRLSLITLRSFGTWCELFFSSVLPVVPRFYESDFKLVLPVALSNDSLVLKSFAYTYFTNISLKMSLWTSGYPYSFYVSPNASRLVVLDLPAPLLPSGKMQLLRV